MNDLQKRITMAVESMKEHGLDCFNIQDVSEQGATEQLPFIVEKMSDDYDIYIKKGSIVVSPEFSLSMNKSFSRSYIVAIKEINRSQS